MIKYWADTSALLHQHNILEPDAIIGISPLTLSELEHIKTSTNEDAEIKYLAREAIRNIISTDRFETTLVDNKRIDKMLKKYPFLSNINDHRIICAAEITAID